MDNPVQYLDPNIGFSFHLLLLICDVNFLLTSMLTLKLSYESVIFIASHNTLSALSQVFLKKIYINIKMKYAK